MTLDTSTVIVLVLAAALAGALIAVLPDWRRLMNGNLPIHKHLGAGRESPRFEATLRCALCAGRQTCAGRSAPLPDCPNGALFRQAPSGTTVAPRA